MRGSNCHSILYPHVSPLTVKRFYKGARPRELCVCLCVFERERERVAGDKLRGANPTPYEEAAIEEAEWRRVERGRGGLAGAGKLGSLAGFRRRRIGVKVMSWWQRKMVFPVKRAWLVVFSRVKSQKHGGGILQLYDDVQMCGYEDVQVMWEMLTRPHEMETATMAKQRKASFWRLSSWYSRRLKPISGTV